MNSAIASIPRLFEFLGILGKGIRAIVGQSKDVHVAGKGRVTIVFELGPQLEGVIRDIVAREGGHEDPKSYWYRATRDLIKHDEDKFRALSQLAISDIAIGTEAIMQHADAVPESIANVTVRYVERFVLTPVADETDSWELPPSSLSNALHTVIRNASEGNAFSLTDRLGEPRVKPQFGRDKQS